MAGSARRVVAHLSLEVYAIYVYLFISNGVRLAGLPPPALNAAAAEGAARGRDGAQEADDGQRLGVKRRLDGELASARVNDDDAKEGDTIMVDAAQMAAAAAAGTDRGTKRLLHVALAARDGKHIPDIQNMTALLRFDSL